MLSTINTFTPVITRRQRFADEVIQLVLQKMYNRCNRMDCHGSDEPRNDNFIYPLQRPIGLAMTKYLRAHRLVAETIEECL